jgi:hypothetical protein
MSNEKEYVIGAWCHVERKGKQYTQKGTNPQNAVAQLIAKHDNNLQVMAVWELVPCDGQWKQYGY